MAQGGWTAASKIEGGYCCQQQKLLTLPFIVEPRWMHDTHFLVDLPLPYMQIRKPAEPS